MEHNQIIPTKPIKDEKLKKEIEDFKFFLDMATLKILKIIKMGIFSNPNVKRIPAKNPMK
ncbi:Csa1 family protein [Staphylococcus aureus]